MSPCLSFSISSAPTSSSTNSAAIRPPPSFARDHQPSRLLARLKVRPTSRSIRCTGKLALASLEHGALEFGAWFDAELLGEPALVGGERQVGREQCGLAGADHLDQVQACQRIGVGQGLQALRIQLDRDRVERAAVDRIAHGFDAGLRHVRGAQQRVAHAVALDDGVGLVGQDGIQCRLRGGLDHGCTRHGRSGGE